MACFKPLVAWRGRCGGPVFSPPLDTVPMPMQLPCGQCIGCRLERSRQWAVRCMHEASLHADNCFITLTYNNDSIPHGGSLVKSDFQSFVKRLRKDLEVCHLDLESWTCYTERPRIKYFACGEYGDQLSRPHYHACIFGFDFEDRKEFKKSNGISLYRSERLSRLWPYGHSLIGDVTFESAAYVARYVTKKVTGDYASEHYTRIDEYGEMHSVLPEFSLMSRGGRRGKGLAAGWFERWGNEVYPSDEVVVRGRSCAPPRYYGILAAEFGNVDIEAVKRKRLERLAKHAADCTPERLADREFCSEARMRLLKRAYEIEGNSE